MSAESHDEGFQERDNGRRQTDAFKHYATWGAGIAGVPVAALILYIAQALGTLQAKVDALNEKVDIHCHIDRK